MKVIIYLFVNWVRIHAHVSYWNGVVRWNAYIFWNVAHWSSDAFISIWNTIFHAQFCFCFFQTKKKNGILWQNNKLNTNGCASIAVAAWQRENIVIKKKMCSARGGEHIKWNYVVYEFIIIKSQFKKAVWLLAHLKR